MKVKASAPLFRDPIFDGPTDPTIIWNREEKSWWIFYTQRRSTEIAIGVSTIHGTAIGIASSTDGGKWLYRGTAQGIHFEHGHNTFWAPEVIYAEGKYHMYVSYITGVPADWDYDRHIVHFSADNLWEWKYEGIIELSSNRVIDACVQKVGEHLYKMWYKEERDQSHTYAAVSSDLYHWEVKGPEITDCPHEGPNVFEFKGKKWMIVDCWDGQGLYRSDDYEHWERGPQNLLKKPGTRKGDNNRGHHADVLVTGDKAYILYFTHPYLPKEEIDENDPEMSREGRTVLQMAELVYDGDWLVCNRDEELYLELEAPV